MLVAHKVIDALRGGKGLIKMPGVDEASRNHVAGLIEVAQKFDFGDLALEATAEVGHWSLPRLTDDELSFWREGLLPLPFASVWYEFVIGDSRSGLLVVESNGEWIVNRIDYVIGKEVLFDQIACVVKLATAIQAATPIVTTMDHKAYKAGAEKLAAAGDWVGDDREFKVDLIGNDIFLKGMRNNKSFLSGNLGMNVPLAIYLTLMLSSRTTEVRQAEVPSEKLIKAQRRRGKTPLPPHRIVRIVPERFQQAAEAEGHASRRPPRLHWRRSHVRHYEERVPSAQWAPNRVHKGKTGWWVSVIARMLVGRADLGEVSHEYFVNKGESHASQAAR